MDLYFTIYPEACDLVHEYFPGLEFSEKTEFGFTQLPWPNEDCYPCFWVRAGAKQIDSVKKTNSDSLVVAVNMLKYRICGNLSTTNFIRKFLYSPFVCAFDVSGIRVTPAAFEIGRTLTGLCLQSGEWLPPNVTLRTREGGLRCSARTAGGTELSHTIGFDSRGLGRSLEYPTLISWSKNQVYIVSDYEANRMLKSKPESKPSAGTTASVSTKISRDEAPRSEPIQMTLRSSDTPSEGNGDVVVNITITKQ